MLLGDALLCQIFNDVQASYLHDFYESSVSGLSLDLTPICRVHYALRMNGVKR